ncbi:MAG TPA: HDOD domain-containing protein [Desulfosalsimonadaceae bacterium]|nr:HDOD domain-containing protein [Desulfosalsimonadaceae bacterium]
MHTVGIHQLSPGMVLRQDVKDPGGRLLAPAGQEVTEKLIRVFKIWGVAGDLRIQGREADSRPAEEAPEIPPGIRSKAEEFVKYRFQFNDLNDPFVAQLFDIAVGRKAEYLLNHPEEEPLDHFQPEAPPVKRNVPITRKKVNVDYLIQKTLHMGAMPDVYYKTIAAINNPETSLDDIAGIVSKDTTLSAKVLQLVNSSFYSLKQKVDTLTWALALIGTNQLMTIVSGVSAVSLFKNIPSQLLSMVSFWEHSIACGTAAQLLSSYYPERMDAERFFVAGLLHDIGRMILVQNLAGRYYEIFQQARREEVFLFTAEKESFGADHAEIGAELAQQWNLPANLVSMIRRHHFPDQDSAFFESAIINLADIIVNALEIGSSGEFFVPVIEPNVCQDINLDREMLQSVVNEIDNQLGDIFEIIYGIPE